MWPTASYENTMARHQKCSFKYRPQSTDVRIAQVVAAVAGVAEDVAAYTRDCGNPCRPGLIALPEALY